MNIYLIKNNVNAGPYSESEVMARVKDGSYSATDLAWFDGCTTPVPLMEFLCRPAATAATAQEPTTTRSAQEATPHEQEAFSAHDLRLIAENYRFLFGTVLCWLIGLFIPMSPTIYFGWVIAVSVMWIRSGWSLSKGLHKRPWLWVVWSLLPLANICAMIRILYIAAKTLKANGIPFSWYGVDQPTLSRLIEADGAVAPPQANGTQNT